MEVKIDLRPHYTFAYYSASMEFGDKDLLYYSRKDKSLHYKIKASEFNFFDKEDKEYIYPITDDDVKALQEVFGLVIDAHKAYFDHQGETWEICDGSDCTIICGRRRIHFEEPSIIEPIRAFCEVIYRNLMYDTDHPEPDFKGFIKELPLVVDLLKGYIESPVIYIEKGDSSEV